MLFILALQHQRSLFAQKEVQPFQSQLFKETIQHQSNLLRESLLRQAKQMKRQLKRQERLNQLQNDFEDETSFGNDFQIQENYPVNLDLIYNDEQNIFQMRNDSPEVIPHRHSHNNLTHHRRCKSKGINNFNLLEESKINDEKLIKNENVKKCTICLGDYKLGDKISYLPCFHLYHSKCIKKWLKLSKICPLCKKEVNFNNEIY